MPWSDVVGHDAVLQKLLSAHARGRLGHAFLFVGPTGVGKRRFAYEFAAALLCERSPGPLSACGHCQACVQIFANTHPDVVTVRTPEDKHELPVEVVRGLCRQMAMRPSRGSRMIGIVEDADDFNEESANCFLKTLEEPAPGSVLMLLATGSEKQLPTILSRTQMLRFLPLSQADMTTVLHKNGITNPAVLERGIRLGQGCPGQALALSDADLWSFRTAFLENLTSARPDPVALTKLMMESIDKAGKDSSLQRARSSFVLQLVVDFLRTALRTGVTEDAEGHDPQAKKYALKQGVEGILEHLEAANQAEYWNQRKVQIALGVEGFVAKLLKSSFQTSRTGGS
jgi:DNA polymerase III subunit delta'